MTARKKTTKAASARKTTRKKAATGGKKPATARKTATRAGAGADAEKEPAEKRSAEKAPAKKAKGAVSSTAVNMGAIFALRPRVNTSFRPEDLLTARRLLDEESYSTIEEAARAVAERALELSNEPKGKRGNRRGR